ncbi:hypothetical protein KC19_8G080200 [Ceratodon purpureus]|uniref:HMA domain-containing protein n=1 Tax=Ceratodon purpureus TaxID=3225 RepID=A0A8T0H035_CERPU|nr:hypothetical protein KC19_8G080200 [Ceratodon purpureus]
MASMTELFYGDQDPTWSFSTFYDYNDHNGRHEVDPQYTQDYITRYMQPPIEIKCCSRCEDRLRVALRNIPGVDNVVSTHNNKKLIVTGSADNNTIHYALKHIQKRHRHFLPQKLHNPFRLLFPRHSHSRYTPSWNNTMHTSSYNHNNSYAHNYDSDKWKYDSKYGHGYDQGPQHHYKPGSLRQILFDSRRSSHHSHSGYSYH